MRALERGMIRFRRADRMAGAALAILVQAALIALLMFSRSPLAPIVKAARELIFVLPRLEKAPPPPPAKPKRVRAPASAPAIPQPAVPPLTPPAAINPLPFTPTPEQLQGLGQSLFGCAPENWSNLTPSQRAHCTRPGEGVAIQSVPSLLGAPDHVKDEALWEDRWEQEKSAPMLPCGGLVNVLCILNKIADGTLSDYGDPSTWPYYGVKQLPENDLYKIEQAYAAWKKAHPVRQDSAASAPAASP